MDKKQEKLVRVELHTKCRIETDDWIITLEKITRVKDDEPAGDSGKIAEFSLLRRTDSKDKTLKAGSKISVKLSDRADMPYTGFFVDFVLPRSVLMFL